MDIESALLGVIYFVGIICSFAFFYEFAEDFLLDHGTFVIALCAFFPILIVLSFLFAPLIYILRSTKNGMDKC